MYYNATVIETLWYQHKINIYRYKQQNRESKSTAVHIWSVDAKVIQWRKNNFFQEMVLKQFNNCVKNRKRKERSKLLLNTMCKSQLEMDYRPKCKSSRYKASRKKLKKITVALSLGKISLKKKIIERLPRQLSGKESPASEGDVGLTPDRGRSHVL